MNAIHQLHCRLVFSSQPGVHVFSHSCSETIWFGAALGIYILRIACRHFVHQLLKLLVAGVDDQLPWIMLMPGFNCYASDYSTMQHLLASRGYLVAIADEFHPVSSVTVGPVLSCECC